VAKTTKTVSIPALTPNHHFTLGDLSVLARELGLLIKFYVALIKAGITRIVNGLSARPTNVLAAQKHNREA
jgi:hypothetical protein